MAELRDLQISGRVVISVDLLSVRYSRSGGPGGQHVNKTESKADLRLDLERCVDVIGETRVAKIRKHLNNRLDGDENLQIVSSEHRSQSMNLEAALARMEKLIREALAPKKARRKTKPSRASKQRRLDAKRQRSQVKKQRRSTDD
jgi:ribosome-associated protein